MIFIWYSNSGKGLFSFENYFFLHLQVKFNLCKMPLLIVIRLSNVGIKFGFQTSWLGGQASGDDYITIGYIFTYSLMLMLA